MGCDIHMNVEVRRDGRWKYVTPPIVHESWNKNPEGRKTWWDDRSYITFAVLAGVRADSGDPEPIAEPRGYPDDADAKTLHGRDYHYAEKPCQMCDGQDHGDHSASWLTLDEVLGYDWEQSYWEEGVVGLAEYVRCKQQGDSPESWSKWVGGRSETLTEPQAKAFLRSTAGQMYLLEHLTSGPTDGWGIEEKNVQWRWKLNLAEQCASFLKWARDLPAMLAAEPKDIRLVFSFDS